MFQPQGTGAVHANFQLHDYWIWWWWMAFKGTKMQMELCIRSSQCFGSEVVTALDLDTWLTRLMSHCYCVIIDLIMFLTTIVPVNSSSCIWSQTNSCIFLMFSDQAQTRTHVTKPPTLYIPPPPACVVYVWAHELVCPCHKCHLPKLKGHRGPGIFTSNHKSDTASPLLVLGLCAVRILFVQ